MYYLISVDIDTLIVRESDEVIGDLENIEVGNDVKIIYKGKQLEVPVEAISGKWLFSRCLLHYLSEHLTS